jgi:predicted ATPase
LRAATSLARLLQNQDRAGEAYDLLSNSYARFTEGLETLDLRDARNYLNKLQEADFDLRKPLLQGNQA